jgi:hypothetical protein
MLADSNLIIYAASGDYPDLVEWFAETTQKSAIKNSFPVHRYQTIEDSVTATSDHRPRST